jgi:predicted SnoaL-like aldol condensation-catalyzing enzyme
MSAETNKMLVKRFYEEILTQRNPDLLDEIFTSDYVYHSPNMPSQFPSGLQGFKQFVTEFLSGYPDLHFTVGDQAVEGDKVVSHITARSSSMVGPVMTMPTNPEKVAEEDTIQGTSTDRFVNGKIAESWIQFNVPNPLPQIEKYPEEKKSNQ